MKWTQVDISGPNSLEEIAIACLAGVGCSGVQVIRDEDLPEYYDETTGAAGAVRPIQRSRGAESTVIVRGYLPEGANPSDEIRGALSRAFRPGETTVSIGLIEDTGWSKSWRKHHKPIRVGGRIVVAPTWSKVRERTGDIVLRIDPGMAFGTGQHATTRLSLQALQQVITPGCEVIDVGCGSGVLSIAAVKLGARSAIGFDTDCVAGVTALNNVKINGVEDRVSIRQAPLAPPYPPADVVVANILAGVVVELAPAALACLSASSGVEKRYITSGFTLEQEHGTQSGLEERGLEILQHARLDGWVCFTARPRPAV
ncbi:MAG TPA: 50S ribosomal protein L11 methyltransferase [Armatimonadota bacterium]|nr:50S ribosomal protein L11 methyltransferase [Armatimonadota bacterium]